jgi:hypothetical protein
MRALAWTTLAFPLVAGCATAPVVVGGDAAHQLSARGIELSLPDGFDVQPLTGSAHQTRWSFHDSASRCNGELALVDIRDAAAHARAVREVFEPHLARWLEGRGYVPRRSESRGVFAAAPAHVVTFRIGTGVSTDAETDVLQFDAHFPGAHRSVILNATCREPTLVHALYEQLGRIQVSLPAAGSQVPVSGAT